MVYIKIMPARTEISQAQRLEEMERYFRDAKAASIAGGTVELQLMNIASEMGI